MKPKTNLRYRGTEINTLPAYSGMKYAFISDERTA